MGHCVNLYIVKKEHIKDPTMLQRVPYVDANMGYIFIPTTVELEDEIGDEAVLGKLLSNNRWVRASTDYFGGTGDQEATSCVDGSTTDHERINGALRRIGYEKSDDSVDEFDSIGLGTFRSNDKIIEHWRLSKKIPKKTSNKHKIFLLKKMPDAVSEIQDVKEYTKTYVSDGEYYVHDDGQYFKVELSANHHVEYVEYTTVMTPVDEDDYKMSLINGRKCDCVVYETGPYQIIKYNDSIILGVVEYGTVIAKEFEKYVLSDVTDNHLFYNEYNFVIREDKKPMKPVLSCPECGNHLKADEGGLACTKCPYKWSN